MATEETEHPAMMGRCYDCGRPCWRLGGPCATCAVATGAGEMILYSYVTGDPYKVAAVAAVHGDGGKA